MLNVNFFLGIWQTLNVKIIFMLPQKSSNEREKWVNECLFHACKLLTLAYSHSTKSSTMILFCARNFIISLRKYLKNHFIFLHELASSTAPSSSWINKNFFCWRKCRKTNFFFSPRNISEPVNVCWHQNAFSVN